MMTLIITYKINLIKLFALLILMSLIVWAGCDKEVSRSPVESEAPKGFIHINSIPAGFTIFQNGRNTGRLTPDSISYIEAGVYEIILRKKYFKDTSLVVTLNENEKLNNGDARVYYGLFFGCSSLHSIQSGTFLDLLKPDSLLKQVFIYYYYITFKIKNQK